MKQINRTNALILLICTTLSLSLVITGCGGSSGGGGTPDGTTYKNQILPSKTSINIPESLGSSHSGKKGTVKLSKLLKGTTPGNEPMGYMMLNNIVDQVKEFSGDLDFEFLFIDSALAKLLSENTGDIDKTLAKGEFTFTFTQEMSNSLQALYDKYDVPTDERDNIAVGEQIECPEIQIIIDSNAADGYTHTVIFTDSETGYEGTYSIKWNAERTKIKVSDIFKITEGGYTYEGNNIAVLDNSGSRPLFTMQCTYKNGTEEFKFSIKLQETGTNNGVIVECSMNANDCAMTLKGAADDNGGYIEATTRQDSHTFVYKESFDSNGEITGCIITIDGTDQPVGEYGAPVEGNYQNEYTSAEGLDTISVTINGLDSADEGDSFVIALAGTTTPASDADMNSFYEKVIGGAIYVNGTFEVDYWGTTEQASGAVIFKVSYNNQNLVLTATVGASISASAK